LLEAVGRGNWRLMATMRMARERRPRSLPSCVLSAIPSTSLLFLGEHRFHCTQDTSIGAGMLDVKSERIGRTIFNAHAREHDFQLHCYPLLRIACCCVSSKQRSFRPVRTQTGRPLDILPSLPDYHFFVV
jgi:hypothetical protein